MTTMRQAGPPAAAMRAATVLRLPQRELAAARAESKLAWCGTAVSAAIASLAAGERLDARRRRALGLGLVRGAACVGSARPNSRVSASEYGADRVGVAERLQLLGRRQQQLLDDQVRDLVDARAGLGRQRRQLEVEPLELGAADRLEPLPQRDDGRDRAARAQPARRTSRPPR